jgi:hypothetical protein
MEVPDLTPSMFNLLGRINKLCQLEGGCYASNAALLPFARCRPTGLSELLTELVERGLITRRWTNRRRYIEIHLPARLPVEISAERKSHAPGRPRKNGNLISAERKSDFRSAETESLTESGPEVQKTAAAENLESMPACSFDEPAAAVFNATEEGSGTTEPAPVTPGASPTAHRPTAAAVSGKKEATEVKDATPDPWHAARESAADRNLPGGTPPLGWGIWQQEACLDAAQRFGRSPGWFLAILAKARAEGRNPGALAKTLILGNAEVEIPAGPGSEAANVKQTQTDKDNATHPSQRDLDARIRAGHVKTIRFYGEEKGATMLYGRVAPDELEAIIALARTPEPEAVPEPGYVYVGGIVKALAGKVPSMPGAADASRDRAARRTELEALARDPILGKAAFVRNGLAELDAEEGGQ